MDLGTFKRLAAEYNVVPVYRERFADFDTPISVAAKLERRGRFFLLESVEGGEKWGRYSILGGDIRRDLVIVNDQAVLREHGQEQVLPGNPVAALQQYLAGFRAPQLPELPRFFGGAVGYFAFEAVRFFERCGPAHAAAANDFPDAHFMFVDRLIIFDNVSHTVKLVCCVHPQDWPNTEAAYAAGQQALDELEAVVREPAVLPPRSVIGDGEVRLESNMSPAAYAAMVTRAKQYITNGDIIQVVLAQHFRARISAPHLDVYRALRYINPSPYLYYLKLDDQRTIAGSSPEVMVRLGNEIAEIRPIAGTRPRGQNEAEDLALADELLADPKERAEHVMLVDLARNDLGRIAQTGTVEVTEYMDVERYSHVMHIVSSVRGRVCPQYDALDVFKASFPAGTLSGAPKVRAMEIINELEPLRRGPYGGALGYIAYGGRAMDLAITIRTVVLDGPEATVTAGAGIVYDSVPEREYQETLHKSRGMKRALELAERGLLL